MGLTFGTALTLLVIPSLYSIVYKVDFSTYEYKGTAVLEDALSAEKLANEEKN